MLDINGLLSEVAFTETFLWPRQKGRKKAKMGNNSRHEALKDLHRGFGDGFLQRFASS